MITLERRDVQKSLVNHGGHRRCHNAMAVNHGVPAEACVPFRVRCGCSGYRVRGRVGFRELAKRRDDERERKRRAFRNTVYDRNTAEAHVVLRVTHRGFIEEFVERVGHDRG